LQQQLNAKEQYRIKLLSGKHTEEQAAGAEKELRDLLTQYQEVQAQIRTTSPRYAELMQPQPLSLKEIQQQVLDEDTMLLEYALGEERSYLWAVTPTSIASFELPKRAEIEETAKHVYQLLTAPNENVKGETDIQKMTRIARAEAEYPNAAAGLSQMLLGPVAAQLGNKRLLIVSDGALQYIPFAALPVPDSRPKTQDPRPTTSDQRPATSDQRPLIADHEIVHLPSASVLAVLRKELAGRKPAPKAVAVLADPVFQGNDPRVKRGTSQADKQTGKDSAKPSDAPMLASALDRSIRDAGLTALRRLRFTQQEADGIIALAPAKEGLKALDFAANKRTATSADLSHYRIVHFATHGLLNDQHPELSGVVLSLVDEQGRPQDGFLQLHEVYNLNLPAELVVLSACKTALGKEIKGEGLVGLTRGFMYAGATRVVASLWSVDDQPTAEFMKRFYQEMLAKGQRPAAALRAAQVAMWKKKKPPYDWAAFVLQGEWR
jgi:CHAT domain-containing protein